MRTLPKQRLKHFSPECPDPLSSMPSTSGKSDNAIPLSASLLTFSTGSDGTVDALLKCPCLQVSCQMPTCYHGTMVCPAQGLASSGLQKKLHNVKIVQNFELCVCSTVQAAKQSKCRTVCPARGPAGYCPHTAPPLPVPRTPSILTAMHNSAHQAFSLHGVCILHCTLHKPAHNQHSQSIGVYIHTYCIFCCTHQEFSACCILCAKL